MKHSFTDAPFEPCALAIPALRPTPSTTPPVDSECLLATQLQVTDTEFVHPDSLQSRLSPAAYLAELYRLTGGNEGKLQQRRPDLASLPLTELSMHEEVSALTLANQALEAAIIQKESGLTDWKGLDNALNAPQTSLLSIFQRDDQFIQLALRALGSSYQQVNTTLGGSTTLLRRPAPMAVLRLNAVEQVYFWNNATHSCYHVTDKAFYASQRDYDAQGRRLNSKIEPWPTDKTLAAAVRDEDTGALYLFWHDHTYSQAEHNANAQLVSVTAPTPISSTWGGYPTGNKSLVAVCMPDTLWMLFFWQDGTHSGYDLASKAFAKGQYDFNADGYRANSKYGLPLTKTISAIDYLGTKGAVQVFWDDGTHSKLSDYALVKDREGYDKEGYRNNEIIPDWDINTNSPPRLALGLSPLQWDTLSARSLLAPATPLATLNLSPSDILYFWPDSTHSCYNSTEQTWYQERNGFDAQGHRRNDALPGWPANKTLAGAFQHWDGRRYLLWIDHTHSILSVDSAGKVSGVDAPVSSAIWTGYPTGNKRLVAASMASNDWFILFWADGTHSGYERGVGFAKGRSGFDADGYRSNSHYGLPTTKTVSAVEYLGVANHVRVFWHDNTHSHLKGKLVTDQEGFDAQGYRSNSTLPAWPLRAVTVQPPPLRPSQQGTPPCVVTECLPLPEAPKPSRYWPLTGTLSDTSGELTLRTLSRHTAEPTFVPSVNAERPVLHLTGQTLFCMDTFFQSTPCALILRWRTDSPGELLSFKQLSTSTETFALVVDEQALVLLLCGQAELALPLPSHDPDDVCWHHLLLNIDADTLQLSVDGQCPVTMPYTLTLGGQQLLSLGCSEWQGELADLQLFDCLLTPGDVAALPPTPQQEHNHHE
ncbi:Tc toxin subunit A [Aeromonas salmonicida]|uniref:Tc toxin subunit A n=1 Tax=Aeromonas salmonicida TaxID=645 RepID=UPI002796DE03|nr:Tc toxin subunit A [Aeromonas salmonicida]MDQ1886284.1 Tc toxin subunit A [Aeromonas salmonicida]